MVSPLTWWSYLVEWAQGHLDDHPEDCDCRACFYSSLDRSAKPSVSWKSYQRRYDDETLSEEEIAYWVGWFATRFPETHACNSGQCGPEYLSNSLKSAGRNGVGLTMLTYVEESPENLSDAQWETLVSSRARNVTANGDFIDTLSAVAEVGPVQLVQPLDPGCLVTD